jgi:adenylate cyclase
MKTACLPGPPHGPSRNDFVAVADRELDRGSRLRGREKRYVLEGSVRKAGNRVRLTGQLIDTATGAHIWADRFDGTLADIFELQDQVASRAAS